MKVINTEKMNPKQRLEAENEVNVLKAFTNPFIIKYMESFIHNKVICIVMDYADGGDLFKVVNYFKNKKQHIKEKTILKIFT